MMARLRSGSRSALWFAAAFGLLFLVRVPFLLIHYIPYHVPFEPWVALIPLLGVLWGAPAVLAIGAATVLSDWMGGLRGALPLYHGLGMMAWAWSARTLWIVRPPAESTPDAPARVPWSAALYFLVISLPGALVAATCIALGADFLRAYPFSYIATIAALNNVFFLLVFGAVLYRLFARVMVPHFGARDDDAEYAQRPAFLALFLQILGAVGAWGIGYLVAIRLGYPARGPVVLGDTAGMRLLPGVLPLLLLFGIGLFYPIIKKRTHPDTPIQRAGAASSSKTNARPFA